MVKIKSTKIISLFVIICIVLGIIQTPPRAKAQDNLVELNVWINPYAGEYGPPPDDWDVYKILRDKFGIDLKLGFLSYTQDGADKLNTQAAANNLPDLFQLQS